MPVEGDVSASIDETGRLDAGYPARSGRQAHLVNDVRPSNAGILADPQVAIVGPDVKDIRAAGRLGQSGGTAALGSSDLGGNGFEFVAVLQGTKNEVAGAIIDPGVVSRQNERRVPVEAIRL